MKKRTENIKRSEVLCLFGEVAYAKGITLVMPANTPHAVFGKGRFKMLLTVILLTADL